METNFKNNIIAALNYGEVEWDYEGVNVIATSAIKHKKDLINMLRKHPNWDEKRGAIVFKNYIENREPDFVAACNCIYSATNHFSYDNKYESIINDLVMRITSPEITDELFEFVKENEELYGKFHIRKGQKITKVFRKMLDAGIEEDKKYRRNDGLFTHVEKQFAKFADYTKPAELKRNLYLSINPADFLLMSNGNSWTSCHYFDGCHRGGTLSYALDGSSMILFTTEACEDIYDVKEFKINRQVYCYENSQLLQSRLYPNYGDLNKSKLYRNLVEEIICECTGMDNLWFVRSDISKFNINNYSNLHYPDWQYREYNTRFCINKAFMDNNLSAINVGSDGACPVCGYELGDSESMHCYKHSVDSVYCECCEEYHYINDCGEYYINNEWVYVCNSCKEDGEILWCDRCDSWNYKDNMSETNDGYLLCSDCLDDMYQCEHCYDLYKHKSNLNIAYDSYGDEIYLCDDCYNKLNVCPHCGKRYTEMDFDKYPCCGVVEEEIVVMQESAQVYAGA